jgi:hypothetical protein
MVVAVAVAVAAGKRYYYFEQLVDYLNLISNFYLFVMVDVIFVVVVVHNLLSCLYIEWFSSFIYGIV